MQMKPKKDPQEMAAGHRGEIQGDTLTCALWYCWEFYHTQILPALKLK